MHAGEKFLLDNIYPYWYNNNDKGGKRFVQVAGRNTVSRILADAFCGKVVVMFRKFMEKVELVAGFGGVKRDIIFLAISAVALILSLAKVLPLPFDIAWVAIILCGVPIVLEAIIGLVTRFDIKADMLVSMALIASICIHEDFAAGEVAFIMQLGGLLEELTVMRARAGIEKLVHLTPQTARVYRGAELTTIPAEQVRIGDILRVLPGETVPVDGVILRGQTSINQAVMTGESLPVDKTVGDEVSSGTVNQFGAFDMRATKVGEDSSIQRMVHLVQSADAGKAKIVGIADRWATWIVVIALTAAIVTWIVTHQIIRAVTILVVFCPCALVLATPAAIMAAIGNATRHGFLVKDGDALERLASVSKITFDKTGTLTYGTPCVVAAKSYHPDYTDVDIFALCAAAEELSEHPLGRAVVSSFEQENSVGWREYFHNKQDISEIIDYKIGNFEMIPGRGVSATVIDYDILAGNQEMLAEHSITIPQNALEKAEQQIRRGCTIIYVAVGAKFAGDIALSDVVRKESCKTIASLQALSVTPVLLSGDHELAANAIAGELGITEVYANCLPEDKLNRIDAYQQAGEKVCMIGDGINDAPALKKADVGIAMGGVGSDIAVDAADIALVDDEVKELPHLFALAKRMMFTIKCNLTFSMTLNFVAIVLAITGVLNPVIGTLVHNCGSVLVIINSALLLGWKSKKKFS